MFIGYRKGERPQMVKREIVGGVQPWRAYGPGWANAGVHAVVREHFLEDGQIVPRERLVTIYANDAKHPAVAEWLDVAIIAESNLRREIEKELEAQVD